MFVSLNQSTYDKASNPIAHYVTACHCANGGCTGWHVGGGLSAIENPAATTLSVSSEHMPAILKRGGEVFKRRDMIQHE